MDRLLDNQRKTKRPKETIKRGKRIKRKTGKPNVKAKTKASVKRATRKEESAIRKIKVSKRTTGTI